MRIFLLLTAFLLTACALDPSALGEAFSAGAPVLTEGSPHVPGALAGSPTSIAALTSYVLNAVLTAWGTYERRQRKKAENA